MSPVYGSTVDRRALVPRERDVATGRRVASRDDKRNEDRRTRRRRRPSRVVVALLAAVALLAIGGAAFALVDRDDGRTEEAEGERSEATPRPGEATTTAPARATTTTEQPVGAISLSFTGGRFTRRTCVDLLEPSCEPTEGNSFDPLAVRCTPDACTVTFITTEPLDGSVDASGTYPHSDVAGCGTQRWTLRLRPVGTAVTHGIEHPARLVGQATIDADPLVLPDWDCLGNYETYAFDAVPG